MQLVITLVGLTLMWVFALVYLPSGSAIWIVFGFTIMVIVGLMVDYKYRMGFWHYDCKTRIRIRNWLLDYAHDPMTSDKMHDRIEKFAYRYL